MKQMVFKGRKVLISNCGECPKNQNCIAGRKNEINNVHNYHGGHCPDDCTLDEYSEIRGS